MAEVFYYAVFGAFGFVAALLMWKQGIAGKGDSNAAFTSFRNNYLIVYSLQMRALMMGACVWRVTAESSGGARRRRARR